MSVSDCLFAEMPITGGFSVSSFLLKPHLAVDLCQRGVF